MPQFGKINAGMLEVLENAFLGGASAAATTSSVSGLGNSRERSTPISVIAATTAGLIDDVGLDPAERTWTRPAA